jgi:hypothetical protein
MVQDGTGQPDPDVDLGAFPPPSPAPASSAVDLDALPPPPLPGAAGIDLTDRRPRRARPARRVPVARIVARDRKRRRQARWLGAAGFAVAALAPALLFHRVIADIAHEFRLDLRYLLEWAPWVLLVLGLAFLLPVAYSAGLDPDSRYFPRFRRAYAGWGITLYLLGIALATQVAQLYSLHH